MGVTLTTPIPTANPTTNSQETGVFSMDFGLSAREQLVFSQVVASYLSTAAPVGSHMVAQALTHEGRLSSATIRNIMADLERAGLLTHPHTSAGRVPTTQGLRFYIDCLIETEPLSDAERTEIVSRYAETDPSLAAMMEETSRVLSRLSKYAGLIVTPIQHELVVQHLEFVRLSDRRLLGIFVTREGVTHNRVIELRQPVAPSEIEQINNYCNATLRGLTLDDARNKAVKDRDTAKSALDSIAHRAMDYSATVLDSSSADVVIDGGASLLAQPEFASTIKAQALLEAFEQKEKIVEILERSAQSDGIQVFIGAESRFDALADCSVVTSPYRRGGKVLGTLGVIGPTRMAYGRVIPIVQCAAEQMSRWLDLQT